MQYCPRYLGNDARRPHIRRGWCFAHAVACPVHGCRLHDRCWQCGTAAALLEQRTAAVQPLCAECDAVLAEAPTVAAGRASRLQRRLASMLAYLATHMPAAQRAPHLDALAARFGAAIAAPVADRERVVADLLPTTASSWFSSPVEPRHTAPLAMLTEGVRYERLELRAEKRRYHRRRERRRASSRTGAAPELTEDNSPERIAAVLWGYPAP